MMIRFLFNVNRLFLIFMTLFCGFMFHVSPLLAAVDLDEIKQAGVLRHLGVPYANFVSGAGDGMDVELMQRFAAYLGVKYQYVQTDWSQVVSDLTGKQYQVKGLNVVEIGTAPIRGDIIANGMTIIPWRQKVVQFATPTFPTQVWLVARADSPLKPITPSGSISQDIDKVKTALAGRKTLGKLDTCLDPSLYSVEQAGAQVILFPGSLNEIAPALLKGEAELTLLDVPDALVALQKWPGKIKILGPISDRQDMAPAFRPDSPKLRIAFEEFLVTLKRDGGFRQLIEKYYPFVLDYYPEFISDAR
ncbi:MAG TPA: transporter substrate-binding domain-containing protein [Candidatus Competibacteraceae bacterium]|nr:transporter substrate-binding domain-containing protein [Candidatus Competibacteraceae bacterium]